MTDLEISIQLALAIGWKENAMRIDVGKGFLHLNRTAPLGEGMFLPYYTIFDFRDWNVIGPIAAKFDAFPRDVGGTKNHWACCAQFNHSVYADTPQKAIALAVIGSKK
jgi:hypothetical protein